MQGPALARHQAVAKNHFGDQLRTDAGALDRGLDGGTAEVMGGQRRKVTLKTAHGGTGGANDHDGV